VNKRRRTYVCFPAVVSGQASQLLRGYWTSLYTDRAIENTGKHR